MCKKSQGEKDNQKQFAGEMMKNIKAILPMLAWSMQLAASAAAALYVWRLNMLPDLYLWILVGTLVVLLALTALLAFLPGKKGITKGVIVRRITAYVLMLVLTCTGLVMLFRICQPFNVWRTVLYAAALSLCILAVTIPFFGELIFEGWSTLEFMLPQYLLLIIIIQAALPISGGLIKFFDMFNPAD